MMPDIAHAFAAGRLLHGHVGERRSAASPSARTAVMTARFMFDPPPSGMSNIRSARAFGDEFGYRLRMRNLTGDARRHRCFPRRAEPSRWRACRCHDADRRLHRLGDARGGPARSMVYRTHALDARNDAPSGAGSSVVHGTNRNATITSARRSRPRSSRSDRRYGRHRAAHCVRAIAAAPTRSRRMKSAGAAPATAGDPADRQRATRISRRSTSSIRFCASSANSRRFRTFTAIVVAGIRPAAVRGALPDGESRSRVHRDICDVNVVGNRRACMAHRDASAAVDDAAPEPREGAHGRPTSRTRRSRTARSTRARARPTTGARRLPESHGGYTGKVTDGPA